MTGIALELVLSELQEKNLSSSTLFSFASPRMNFAATTAGENIPKFALFPETIFKDVDCKLRGAVWLRGRWNASVDVIRRENNMTARKLTCDNILVWKFLSSKEYLGSLLLWLNVGSVIPLDDSSMAQYLELSCRSMGMEERGFAQTAAPCTMLHSSHTHTA
jgi:hypothetical protein